MSPCALSVTIRNFCIAVCSLSHVPALAVVDVLAAVRAAVVQVRDDEVLLHRPAQNLPQLIHEQSVERLQLRRPDAHTARLRLAADRARPPAAVSKALAKQK
jgi:hypothetical protein